MENRTKPSLGNEEVLVLVELIKTTEKNSNTRLDIMGQRLETYIADHKEQFSELKTMIRDMGTKMDSYSDNMYDNTIKPMNDQIVALKDRQRDMEEGQRKCVPDSKCAIKESELREYCWTNIKRVVYLNVCFMIMYTVILANSNIAINWDLVKNFLKIFID